MGANGKAFAKVRKGNRGKSGSVYPSVAGLHVGVGVCSPTIKPVGPDGESVNQVPLEKYPAERQSYLP